MNIIVLSKGKMNKLPNYKQAEKDTVSVAYHREHQHDLPVSLAR